MKEDILYNKNITIILFSKALFAECEWALLPLTWAFLWLYSLFIYLFFKYGDLSTISPVSRWVSTQD